MKFNAIIGGKEIQTVHNIEIISPWNLKPLGEVSSLSSDQINETFLIAKKAQKKWAETILLDRITILKRWLNLIVLNKAKIATIVSDEVGKNYNDSLSEVNRTIDYFDYSLEEAKRIQPQSYTADSWGTKNKLGIFTYIPKGVILAISPFNYPVNLSLAKIIPALVMGNSVVFKPATNGSMVGSFLGQLSLKADLPKGILNVVTGRGRNIGDVLVSNENINLISFTGSVNVGQKIRYAGKELILELGGKDPAVILDDFNLNNVAKQIISGSFSFSGQRCTAIKRVITTNKIADKLVPILKKLVSELSINNKKNGVITPLIDNNAADYVWELMTEAIAKKAKLVIGMKRKNNLLWPTIIDNVTEEMKLAWEEPFGPVLPIIRIDNEKDIIRIINKSKFGLQASIFTQDINKAFSLANKIDVGTVNINGKTQRGPDSFPFLGVKDSGLGVQGIRETLLSTVRLKGLVINYSD